MIEAARPHAVVAFIDERILQSNWPGRTEWMASPLQLLLYREYTAGENFFARMRALLNRGSPSGALEVYYLCLALGFSGASPGAGGMQAARSYQEAARELLTRSVRGAPLSPNAIPTLQVVDDTFTKYREVMAAIISKAKERAGIV